MMAHSLTHGVTSHLGIAAMFAAGLIAPAAAHENPYTMLTLEVSQVDIPKVRVGYTAVLTEETLFGMADGQRLPVFFLKTDDEPALGMFSDEEMAALCRKYVRYTAKKARKGADPEFGIGALRYNDDGTATRDALAVWTFDDPCTVDD